MLIKEQLLDVATGDEVFFLCHIARLMDKSNNYICYPSISYLSEKTGYSKGHVIRLKAILIKKRLITATPRIEPNGNRLPDSIELLGNYFVFP